MVFKIRGFQNPQEKEKVDKGTKQKYAPDQQDQNFSLLAGTKHLFELIVFVSFQSCFGKVCPALSTVLTLSKLRD